MHQYQEQKFNLPDLKGISAKQLDVHLKLYAGYVKNINLLRSTVAAYQQTDDEGGKFAISEMRRRLAFEFDGMRMHEYYFEQWENGVSVLDEKGSLASALSNKYGSLKEFEDHFKTVAMMRGIGWTTLAWDAKGKTPHTYFVGDHEVGHLAGLPIILTLDMWEHAYMVDYTPAEKKSYIEAFWNNLNWKLIEERFTKAS